MKKILLWLCLSISSLYGVELVENLQDLDITRRILNEDILQTDSNSVHIANLWAEVLYINPTVSFNANDRLAEIGSIINDGDLAFTVNKPMVQRTLTVTGISPIEYGAGGSKINIPITNITSTTIATIDVTDSESNTDSDTITYSFENSAYYGVLSNEFGTLTSSLIVYGATMEDKWEELGDGGTASASNEYIYVAYPSRLGECTSFSLSGMPSSSWPTTTMPITNVSGYTETFRIYRSNQKLITGGITYDIY